jgi:hypothetical protein
MDGFYTMLGLFIFYVTTHFFVIQFGKSWKQRTSYEKFLTIASLVSVALIFLGQ